MAQHYCPNCRERAFVWCLDEENTPNTQWACSLCKFYAEENGFLESVCQNCNTENLMYFRSPNGYFRFCTNCQFKANAYPW